MAKIHKVIGYAMPIETFLGHLKIEIDQTDDLFVGLENALDGVCANRKVGPFMVTDKNGVIDLLMIVGSGDHREHIVFFPTKDWKDDWYRRDDGIDFAFERNHIALTDDHKVDPEDRFEYLERGLYPFGGERMNRAGATVPTPEDGRFDWEDYPDLAPDIPYTLRPVLIESGLLDQEGIAQLRPFRGSWWS